jgi:hypothetical protein
MEGVEWTKVKHTNNGHTMRHSFDPLNANLNINNKNQKCRIGMGCVCVCVCVCVYLWVGGG